MGWRKVIAKKAVENGARTPDWYSTLIGFTEPSRGVFRQSATDGIAEGKRRARGYK